MISSELARRLKGAGLVWAPISGDAFQIDQGEFEGDVMTVSEMTIEAHVYPTGTVLGFNGITEWALDSVALEDALWLPREEQLREALGDAFASLARRGNPIGGVEYAVETSRGDFVADDPAEAYGLALLAALTTR